MRLASLHIHPVKSMRAVDVTRATVEIHGIRHDRRWIVVDANGAFLTQRSRPQLATMTVTVSATGLDFFTEGFGAIRVDRPSGEKRTKVTIWDTEVDAAATDQSIDRYISDVIGEDAHLVFMDERTQRLKTSIWTAAPIPVSFADAFPVLVTTTGSLAELNRDIEAHGGEAVTMARFRPNVVVDCDDAWAEDQWTQLRIGKVTLDLVKPSDRCIVTTTDQLTGERRGKEPLAGLARIHRSKDPRINGVLFGVNAVPRSLGEIRLGDTVESID